MEPLRWILLLLGVLLIAGVFCYSRGWYPKFRLSRAKPDAESAVDAILDAEPVLPPADPTPRKAATARLYADSKVVAVRIMPSDGRAFPAEELILALREAGMRHGQFGIFHIYADDDAERVRFSVASLVEPGSFDLSNLKDSEYRGISIFAIFPAAEDGVELFDDMVKKAREIAKAIDGVLADEQGGAFSIQRERYMREDLIEYLRRQDIIADKEHNTAA